MFKDKFINFILILCALLLLHGCFVEWNCERRGGYMIYKKYVNSCSLYEQGK